MRQTIKKIEAGRTPIFRTNQEAIKQSKQSKQKMCTFSKKTFNSEELRELHLETPNDVEAKLSKRLSPEATTDALKLKELMQRFPSGLFHVTDHARRLYYKVEVNDVGIDRAPVIYYFADDGRSFPCGYFPRPFKIELTTVSSHCITKDVTHFFN